MPLQSVIWPSRIDRAQHFFDGLGTFPAMHQPIPGIATDAHRETLSWQFVASERRFDHERAYLDRSVDIRRADPASAGFDPVRGAIALRNAGNIEEALWLTFLSVHFGRHGRTGWNLLASVYGGNGKTWTWRRVSADVQGFRRWIVENADTFRGAFSNHRKHEHHRDKPNEGTGAVIAGYVDWVGPDGSQAKRWAEVVREGGNDPHSIFDRAYSTFRVPRFGRLGKFDLLTKLGRLRFVPMEPGRPYLDGATGPRAGAKLLFGTRPGIRVSVIEAKTVALAKHLGIGMDVAEDAICNWQKSPDSFVHFEG